MLGAIVIDPVLVLILAVLAGLALLVALGEIAGWRRALSPNAVRAAQKHALADFLPYRRLVRPDVMKNVSGSYTAAWRIAGTDANALAEGDILGAAYQLAATLGSLLPDTVVQLYARRRPYREYDAGRGLDHPVLQLLDELRADFFLRRERVYQTERTLVLTWQPPSKSKERVRALASAGIEAQIRDEDEMLAQFAGLCNRVESALSIRTISLQRLGERTELDSQGVERHRSDLLAFVAHCVTGSNGPVNVPLASVPLNALLAVEGHGGYEVEIGGLQVGAIELKSYPDEAVPLILNRLTELKVAHMLAVRFMPMPVTEVRKELHSAVVDFRGAARFNRGFVDPDMQNASEQAVTAFGKAAGDYTRFGRVNVVLTVRARTRAAVEKAQRAVIAVLEDAGFRAVVRKMGALDTWLSTRRAQARCGIRRHPLDALTLSKLFPIHEADTGRRYNDSEALPKNVPALTNALGPGNTFYRVHLNVRDVGHGFTIGLTGRGKSVMASFLAAMYRGRMPLAGVTTIDRGRSSYQTCAMLGGNFYDLLGPNSPGFALFSEVEDVDQAREVLQILVEMVTLGGVTVTPERYESLQTAVRLMASIPVERRSLLALVEHQLQDPDRTLRPALRKYTRTGELGNLLDCSEDGFVTSRFNVVDIEQIIGMAPEFTTPIMRTIFWKSRSQVRRMKQRMGPQGAGLHWLFNIDEAHTLFRDEIGSRFVVDMLKVGRKENMAVWLSSNSVADFVNYRFRNDLLLQCPSRIFFNDPAATPDDPDTVQLYKDLGLPAQGIAMLPNLPDRSFVLHQPDAGVLRELNLRLERDVLAVIGTSRTIDKVDEFRARFGEDWRVPFLRAQGAEEAADRLAAIVTSQREAIFA
jgi:type IV secretion system protein VirB4